MAQRFSARLSAGVLLLLTAFGARAQTTPGSVGIGTAAPHPKAALDISAADKGLLIPRLTEAQRTALTGAPDGLMVFQTDGAQPGFWYFFGGQWLSLPNGQTAAVTAQNGLTKTGAAVQLGGALTQATTVAAGSQSFSVSSSPGTYQATVTPDAQSTGTIAGSVGFNSATQTFTVQQTGLLKTLAVAGSPQSNVTGTISVRMELYGPLPANALRFSGVTFATGGSTSISLPEGLAVRAGEQYRLNLVRVTSTGGSLFVPYTEGDVYAGGVSSAGTGRDLLFSTGVQLPDADVPVLAVQNGRLGVGTSSPDAALHVTGAARLDALAGTGIRVVTTDGAGNLDAASASTLGDNLGNHTATQNLGLNFKELALGLPTNEFHGLGYYGASTDAKAWNASTTVDGPVLYGFSGGVLGVYRSASDRQVALSWRPSGRVGVGTSSPDAALHVAGGSILTNTDNQGLIVDEGTNRRVGLLKYAGREAGLWRTTGTDFELGRVNVSALPGTPSAFTTDLYLSGAGRVGVGNTDPQQALDVTGRVQASQGVVVPSAQSYAYATRQTRTEVFPFVLFQSMSPQQFWPRYFGYNPGSFPIQIRPYGVGAGVPDGSTAVPLLMAPLQLPQGAVITGLEMRALDNDGQSSAVQLLLVQVPYGSDNPTTLATLATPTNSASLQTVSSGTLNVTIDNASNVYYFRLDCTPNAASALYGLRVTYTVGQVD